MHTPFLFFLFVAPRAPCDISEPSKEIFAEGGLPFSPFPSFALLLAASLGALESYPGR